MKHILNNATEGLAEPWVAYKEGVVYYKNIEPIIPTKVWYEDGSYKEFKIEGEIKGEGAPYGPPRPSTQIDNITNAVKIEFGDSITSINYYLFGASGSSTLTSVTIPDSVTSITEGPFFKCTSLTSVTIPNSVTNIDNDAFNRCLNLTSVTIGNSVTNIGDRAFADCTSLTSVTYNGTIEQWKAITKGMGWKNGVPSTCIVRCTDGDIPI